MSSPILPPEFAARLVREHRTCTLPAGIPVRSEHLARQVLTLLVPHFDPQATRDETAVQALADDAATTLSQLLERLAPWSNQGIDPHLATERFVGQLPGVHRALQADARAHFEGDPAATTLDEVVLAYPGFRAVAYHRIAHALQELAVPLVPRLIAELAHRETGIDIHPGAQIGEAFSIDHGTGVVVGETAVIGDRVKIYQGVTLGAASVRKDLANTKRHPTVGNDVVIYAERHDSRWRHDHRGGQRDRRQRMADAQRSAGIDREPRGDGRPASGPGGEWRPP